MAKDILSRLGEFIRWLLRWYLGRVEVSWHREIRRLGKRKDKRLWIFLCIAFAFILLLYLTGEAFSDGFLLGLSFLWSSFLAISFAYILRHPLLLMVIYVAAVFGREVMSLFVAAKEEAVAGNMIGALILFVLGVYLIIWANRLKKGEGI
jgi:hypothetical protein